MSTSGTVRSPPNTTYSGTTASRFRSMRSGGRYEVLSVTTDTGDMRAAAYLPTLGGLATRPRNRRHRLHRIARGPASGRARRRRDARGAGPLAGRGDCRPRLSAREARDPRPALGEAG